MPKKRVDRRIVRSREAIKGAFERLLVKMPLSDITVSAIAREANIDRKTFYVHFGTVDGLIDSLAEDAVSEVADYVERNTDFGSLESAQDSDQAARLFFSAVNQAVCSNLVLNRQILENIPLEEFMERVRKPLEREIQMRQIVPERIKDEMFDYYLSYILSGLIGIYRTWALADDGIAIERVSQVANDLTMLGLSSLKGRL